MLLKSNLGPVPTFFVSYGPMVVVFLSAYPPLYGTMHIFSVDIVTELKHVLLNIQLFNQAGGGE